MNLRKEFEKSLIGSLFVSRKREKKYMRNFMNLIYKKNERFSMDISTNDEEEKRQT